MRFIQPSHSLWGALVLFVKKDDHEGHLRLVLELLKKERLFSKFSKCEVWLPEVHFLRHVVDSNGSHVHRSKNKVANNCKALKTPLEIWLDCVLMQRGKVLPYASRQLKMHEKNYTTHDLELRAVVFAFKTRRHYLYEMKSVIYMDHKSLQHIFDQKELNMCQRRWIKLFSDYECEIRYHPCKENVVADALSRRVRVKPKSVREMAMTIQFRDKRMILAAHSEAFKEENSAVEMLRGLDQLMEKKENGGMYFIWVPLIGYVRTLIMDEAHTSRYLVHPGVDKT
nr:putative reverse transcriptase domain-containing protein [Tanacetum cinerariifolium]